MPECGANLAPPLVVTSKGRGRLDSEMCQLNSKAVAASQPGEHSREVT